MPLLTSPTGVSGSLNSGGTIYSGSWINSITSPPPMTFGDVIEAPFIYNDTTQYGYAVKDNKLYIYHYNSGSNTGIYIFDMATKSFQPDRIPIPKLVNYQTFIGFTTNPECYLFATWTTGSTGGQLRVFGYDVNDPSSKLIDKTFPKYLNNNYGGSGYNGGGVAFDSATNTLYIAKLEKESNNNSAMHVAKRDFDDTTSSWTLVARTGNVYASDGNMNVSTLKFIPESNRLYLTPRANESANNFCQLYMVDLNTNTSTRIGNNVNTSSTNDSYFSARPIVQEIANGDIYMSSGFFNTTGEGGACAQYQKINYNNSYFTENNSVLNLSSIYSSVFQIDNNFCLINFQPSNTTYTNYFYLAYTGYFTCNNIIKNSRRMIMNKDMSVLDCWSYNTTKVATIDSVTGETRCFKPYIVHAPLCVSGSNINFSYFTDTPLYTAENLTYVFGSSDTVIM